MTRQFLTGNEVFKTARKVAVIPSKMGLSEGLAQELFDSMREMQRSYRKNEGRAMVVFITDGDKQGEAAAMKILEDVGIPYVTVREDSGKHVREDAILYVLANTEYAYLSFDGEDNEVGYALGLAMEGGRPFKISQDRPTSPKQMWIDVIMRGMKQQAEEAKARAEAKGESAEGHSLKYSKNYSGVDSLEYSEKGEEPA